MVAMIIMLLSILIVAVNAANRTSQRANTRFLMNSLKQALVSFKDDVGYYPPVLGTVDPNPPAPDEVLTLMEPPDPGEPVQSWFSQTSLADYLIGYGDDREDGYGAIDDTTKPAPGIRHPGTDGVWMATVNGGNGTLEFRNLTGNPFGKVYGPFLELKEKRLLASTDGTTDLAGTLRIFFPGDGGYNEDDPKVIVDYWSRPIRYYRRPYPPGALNASYRLVPGVIDLVPTLAEVFLLRPFTMKPGTEADSYLGDAAGDTSVSLALKTAEFALFSSGPDRALNAELRYDDRNNPANVLETSFSNQDNIVELGP